MTTETQRRGYRSFLKAGMGQLPQKNDQTCHEHRIGHATLGSSEGEHETVCSYGWAIMPCRMQPKNARAKATVKMDLITWNKAKDEPSMNRH